MVTRRDGNFGRSDQGYGTKRNRTPIRILHVLSFAGGDMLAFSMVAEPLGTV
jgi:hypothetical protein